MTNQLDARVDELNETGYLVIRDALSVQQVKELTEVVDRLWHDSVGSGRRSAEHFFMRGFFGHDPSFPELADNSSVLPVVYSVLGGDISVYHSHLDVNPTQSAGESSGYAWHQDMPVVSSTFPVCPPFSLKVAYYLSDVSAPDRGNLHVIPGSHRPGFAATPQDIARFPESAIPVLATPGSAVLIHQKLWHSRGLNTSPVTRKALFCAYAYQWVRPRTRTELGDAEWAALSPVQRQLLGHDVDLDRIYEPGGTETALETEMAARLGHR